MREGRVSFAGLGWVGMGEQCLAEGLFLGGLGGALERRGGAGGSRWWRQSWEGEERPRKLSRSGLACINPANQGVCTGTSGQGSRQEQH